MIRQPAESDRDSFALRRGSVIFSLLRLEGEAHASLHLGPVVFVVETAWPTEDWQRYSITLRWLTLNRGPRVSAKLHVSL